MMTKFMNKQRGLLAAIMALVMVFAGAAFVAAEVDAADPVNVSSFEELKTKNTDGAVLSLTAAIDVVEDIELNNVTINTNGFMINLRGAEITGTSTINGNVNATTVTAFSGKISGVTFNTFNIAVTNQFASEGDITVSNCIFGEGVNSAIYVNLGDSFKWIIEGCTFNGEYDENAVNMDLYDDHSTTVTIKGESPVSINIFGAEEKKATIGDNLILADATVSNINLASDAVIEVPAEQKIVADSITGQGSVIANEGSEVSVEESEVVISGDGNVETVYKTVDNVNSAFASGQKEVTLQSNSPVELTNDITIEDGYTLNIIGTTITLDVLTSGAAGKSIIVENGGSLFIEASDIRAPVVADEDAYIAITKAKKMTVTGDQTADLGVGYGNTLVLKDLNVPVGKSIEAYGTVIIEGTVTVQDSYGFNVYEGGYAQIDGNLIVEGGATIAGTADINGSVKIYNADGNAVFDVDGEVNLIGTMDVLKEKNKDKPTNKLDVSGTFNVEGTLTVTGTLKGNVNDMGTIVFNGKSEAGQITIFDGMTITIASVTGTLTVVDSAADIKDDLGKYSDVNKVTIVNAKNVTVSTEVIETVYDDGTTKSRYYALAMTVSGEIAAAVTDGNGSITIADYDVSSDVFPADVTDRTISIGDVVLGKNIAFVIDATDVTIDGTVTVSAKGSSIDNNSTVAVDVLGSIVIVDNGELGTYDVGKVNAAVYMTEDILNSVDTYYYTTLDAALAASADDSDKVIEVLGTMEVATVIEVPAGITLDTDAAIVTIDVDGKITVAVDALLNGGNGTIDVDGMLVIMDKEFGFEAPKTFVYQVLNETETTATYSGLVLALQNAVAGDVITLKQDADITKSVTIPEGVTLVVPKNVTLTVGDVEDDVTLTVAGQLDVQNGGSVAKVGSNDVAIAIPGIVTMATEGSVPDALMDDYVSFDMKVDGRNVHVHSNLAYAAENAVNGAVDVIGDVSGGDVTFTQAEKGVAITITVTADSTLVVGTLTLVGDGASIIATGEITGTISAAAGSVDLDKVSGITFIVGVEETIDSKVDVVIVDGTPEGSLEVASGTISAADGFEMNATKNNKMSVASGATIIVKNEFTTSGVSADKAFVIVDGTISVVKDGEAIIADTTVNGTIDVASEGTLNIISATVNGTISIAEKTDDAAAGIANVTGALVLGTAPALGANGVLSGPIDIVYDSASSIDGYIVAYAGADVSAALIDVVNDASTAKSTEIVINGVPYMTVYVDKSSDLTLADFETFVSDEAYVPGVTWKSPAADGTKIGEVASAEGTMEAAERTLVVSAGVGLQVYIDGLAVANFDGMITVGTHTVSFAVESGYDGANATITVNGVAVSNNGTFTVDVDDKDVVIIASGAVPAQSGSTVIVDDADDGMALTDILLIVLVVLIVIMAIIVALRMMRS